jgi:hypothetical protein
MALDPKHYLKQRQEAHVSVQLVFRSLTGLRARTWAAEFSVNTVIFSRVSKPDKAVIPVYKHINKKYLQVTSERSSVCR